MKNIISIFILFCFISNINAQEQRFKAGLHLGLNAAQLDGDANIGFHKVGLNGGVRVATILNEKMQIVTEINYASRGSQATYTANSNGSDYFVINNRYVEVPVMFSIFDWKGEDDDHYRICFNGGLSYARLINSTAKGATTFAGRSQDYFLKNNLSFILGFIYYPGKNLGYQFRYTRDIIPTYSQNLSPATTPLNADRLLGYYITLGVVRMFGE